MVGWNIFHRTNVAATDLLENAATNRNESVEATMNKTWRKHLLQQ